MQIGLVTDSLAGEKLCDVLATAAGLGIAAVEFGCGNWSSAPHLSLDGLLSSAALREALLGQLAEHGLHISALNCSGNPLHPGEAGQRHRDVTSATIRLAGLLGIRRVVLMSGCPGGPGDANANWITTAWPPEAARVLEWQWREVVIPYWTALVGEARRHGVERLCVELHGQQNVYNVASFHRLREAAGPAVAVNFDPSHLFWMGADPLAAIDALGADIGHVHAKDTRIASDVAARDGLIDTGPMAEVPRRAWSYVTLGDGHDVSWWQKFCTALRAIGYDDVLSIEHEDMTMAPLEGVRRSVDVLRANLRG